MSSRQQRGRHRGTNGSRNRGNSSRRGGHQNSAPRDQTTAPAGGTERIEGRPIGDSGGENAGPNGQNTSQQRSPSRGRIAARDTSASQGNRQTRGITSRRGDYRRRGNSRPPDNFEGGRNPQHRGQFQAARGIHSIGARFFPGANLPLRGNFSTRGSMPMRGGFVARGGRGGLPPNHGPGVNAGNIGVNGGGGPSTNGVVPRTMPAMPGGDPRSTARNNESNWKEWEQVTVIIGDVPPPFTTQDIYNACQQHGSVQKIEYGDRVSTRTNLRKVSVTFEPAPESPFWEAGVIDMHLNNGGRMQFPLSLSPRHRDLPPEKRLRQAAGTLRVQSVPPLSLEFGSFVGDRSILVKHRLEKVDMSDGNSSINLISRPRHSKIEVVFTTRQSRLCSKRYILSMRSSDSPVVYRGPALAADGQGENGCAVVIACGCPPLYKAEPVGAAMKFTFNGVEPWYRNETLHRVTDIVSTDQDLFHKPVSLCNELDDEEFIDIGRCTTFRFVFPTRQSTRDFVSGVRESFTFIDSAEFELLDGRGQKSFWYALHNPTGRLAGSPETALQKAASLAFDVRYALEVCISNGVICEHSLTAEFFVKLQEMEPELARQILEVLADKGDRFWDPMIVFSDDVMEMAICADPFGDPSVIMTRKITVTPTTLIIGPPSPDVTNRVLRSYGSVIDRFVRVQFTAERAEGRIMATSNSQYNDNVYKRVLRVLFSGITIGDRHYQFLAFGNSQLRECAAYFFCETDDITCDKIRMGLGSFDHIDVVAKYAARVGQCFSTTRDIRGAPKPRVCLIDDIERNGYNFTDGVGKVSKEMAGMIMKEMRLEFAIEPTAFQFRMGGCKGVLAVSPDANGTELYIRPSQKKFASDSAGLEIIRCARFTSATLNRQTITILETLGVRPKVFLDLVSELLVRHDEADTNASAAIKLFKSFVDENHSSLILADLATHGFMDTREPFFMIIMHLWKIWSLKLIKEKARITVDKGAFVLGCADETGTLRGHSRETEGSDTHDISKLPQIFLQISDAQQRTGTKIVTGVCIVGRNPSLHPGDIRVVEAIDVPELHHLRDVVAFPTTGDRDVPSMLSGGDLDGDDFFVFWEPTLIPPNWNHAPMDFSQDPPAPIGRPIDAKDLRGFFVTHMKNDSLPIIALQHLAHADRSPQGAKDPKCLKLAELHSTAVDFSKTGKPAEMPKTLKLWEWPHFMAFNNGKKAWYKSHKALGQIYDKVVHDCKFQPKYSSNFDERILCQCPDDKDLLKKVRALKRDYDVAMRRVMHKREIGSEFEIFSGFTLTKPRVGSDYKLQEDVGRDFHAIRDHFRNLCYEAAGGVTTQHMMPLVAAMYKVTHEEVKTRMHELKEQGINLLPVNPLHMPGPPITNGRGRGGALAPERGAQDVKLNRMALMSFPWLFPGTMCSLARVHRDRYGPPDLKESRNGKDGRYDDLELLFPLDSEVEVVWAPEPDVEEDAKVEEGEMAEAVSVEAELPSEVESDWSQPETPQAALPEVALPEAQVAETPEDIDSTSPDVTVHLFPRAIAPDVTHGASTEAVDLLGDFDDDFPGGSGNMPSFAVLSPTGTQTPPLSRHHALNGMVNGTTTAPADLLSGVNGSFEHGSVASPRAERNGLGAINRDGAGMDLKAGKTPSFDTKSDTNGHFASMSLIPAPLSTTNGNSAPVKDLLADFNGVSDSNVTPLAKPLAEGENLMDFF